MPLLDVSWVTSDPMLADYFNLVRRTDAVNDKGRTIPTVTENFVAQIGVVTQQDPSELLRRDDSQIVPRRIFVASTFAFRGASESQDGSTQYQPDQITWPVDASGQPAPGATVYTVEQVLPYSRFGAGTYECVAASQNAIDPAQ